jgi:hypothetical protein
VSASWAPSTVGSGTTLFSGSTYQITSSWADNANVTIPSRLTVNDVTASVGISAGQIIAQSITASTFYSGSIFFGVDGGGRAISLGNKGSIIMGNNMNLSSWQIVCNTTGSIAIDIQKCNYTTYPNFLSITSNSYVQTTSQFKNQSNTTVWTSSLAIGDIVQFVVLTSDMSISRINVILQGLKYV